MKRVPVFPLFLMVALLVLNLGQPLVAGTPVVPDEGSLSSCGVAEGFAAGAMLGAAISALVPGGQTAATILGLTAVTLRVGISVLC